MALTGRDHERVDADAGGVVQATPLLVAPIAGLVALAVCLAVRGLLFLTGTRFSTAYLSYGWQIVPAETLRRQPFSSVWYLHIQPPLFNLMTGVLLRWSPGPVGLTFQLLFLAIACLLVVLSHDVFVRLGASPVVAAAIAVFVFCDPDWIRYELTPQYEVLAALLVVLAIWSVLRLAVGPSLRRWLTLSASLTALVLTRSLFHPLWLLVVLGVTAWWLRGRTRWRDVLLAAALPVLLVGGWLLKNEALFGHATLSSWFGMNLQRAVIAPLTPAQLERLTAEGKVSGLATVQPFSSYAAYLPFTPSCESTLDHDAVAVADRVNGVPNFNYQCYLDVYDQLAKDASAAIRAEPGRYLYGRWWALRDTFSRGFVGVDLPPGQGQAIFHLLDDVYRLPLLDLPVHLPQDDWAFPLVPAPFIPIHFSFTLVLCLLVTVWMLGCQGWAVLRGKASGATLALALAAFDIAWVVVAGGLFELGENARFRIMVQPLLVGIPLVMLAAFVSRRRDAMGA